MSTSQVHNGKVSISIKEEVLDSRYGSIVCSISECRWIVPASDAHAHFFKSPCMFKKNKKASISGRGLDYNLLDMLDFSLQRGFVKDAPIWGNIQVRSPTCRLKWYSPFYPLRTLPPYSYLMCSVHMEHTAPDWSSHNQVPLISVKGWKSICFSGAH